MFGYIFCCQYISLDDKFCLVRLDDNYWCCKENAYEEEKKLKVELES
jgi:hypothetical protein